MSVSAGRPDAVPGFDDGSERTGRTPRPSAGAGALTVASTVSNADSFGDIASSQSATLFEWKPTRSSVAVIEPIAQQLPVDGPILMGAAGLLVLVFVALGWQWTSQWRSPGRRLERTIAEHDTVAILMHPNPDPDAMASAMGVAGIARHVDTETDIYYSGQIRHQENRAFRTVLDQAFDRVSAVGDLDAEAVILVDHNEPRGLSGCEGIEPIAVVDHHPGGGTGTDVTDVRTNYGACATIVTEYYQELGADSAAVGKNGGDLLTTRLATGLLYGILTDTKSLTQGCTTAEFDACQFLYEATDQELLDRIGNPPISEEVLDVKARAITNRTVESPFCVSHVGAVSNVDAIPQAADELSRLEGITAVVVVGRKDDTLHLSGRSRDDRVHMGQVLEGVVQDIPMAGAGGHARMGGGQVSIEHMEGIGPSSGVTESQLVERLFEGMDGNL